MKKVIDLTRPISGESWVFPGQPQPVVFPWTTIENHGYATFALFMVEHTATHVDAPAHFLPQGTTIDMISPERFFGRATALDLSIFPPASTVDLENLCKKVPALEKRLQGVEIVLFKTGAEQHYPGNDYFRKAVGLGEDLAAFLVEQKIKAVGTDAPSIDFEPYSTHRLLLEKNILIYESLANLNEVVDKYFWFCAFPLKLQGLTGSPVRAVAIVEDSLLLSEQPSASTELFHRRGEK